MLQLRQSQSLQQRLTPQQVQYLKLLQLPILTLEQRIKSEIEENPMLEEVGEDEELGALTATGEATGDQLDYSDSSPELGGGDSLAEVASTADSAADLNDEGLGELPPETKELARAAEAEDRLAREEKVREETANEYSFEDFLHDDSEGYKSPNYTQSADEDREESPQAATESFADSLYSQIAMLDLQDRHRALAEEIVGSLDEDGYLRVPLEQIVKDASVYYGDEYTLAEAESLLRKIQRLDPVGVAARSLKECLSIQLDVMKNHSPVRELAKKIITERFDDFVNKRYTALSRNLALELSELKPAIELIQHLNPKPGAPSGALSDSTKYITADFYIERTADGKDFTITLNERGIPALRVNAAYKDLVRKQAPEQGRVLNAEAKDFIKKKFESAKFFIMAIYQRRETMMRVMRSIVNHQRAFFAGGEKFLKPLIYKTIAEDIHMDISTICRVVNGKYCQTDFGVFELKYFFSEAIPTHAGEDGANEGGEAVANKVVKTRIKEIIDAESGSEPLSDEKIVQLLNTEGFDVARRTVAKYREQLNIPVARLRKKL